MSYVIELLGVVDRESIITSEVNNSGRQQGVVYRGRQELMPTIRIPIQVPLYRMANGRTNVAQLEYVTQHSEDADFFSTGEENVSAQRGQHSILLEMSKAATGPIYQELEEVARQDEPLLVTATGVVVNGNRRLAAMRDLFAKNGSKYKGFSHVDVVVLPRSATDIDLEVIEAQLQMVRDTKLEYGWIEERLKLRQFRDRFGMKVVEIGEIMRIKEDDVNRRIEELELAEEYLDNFLGKRWMYRLVAQSEQMFTELAKELRRKSGDDAELARLIGFNLISGADGLENRAYHFRDAFGRNSIEITRRLATEFGIDTEETHLDASRIGDDDPLAGLVAPAPSYVLPLRELLGSAEAAKENAKHIASIQESIRSEKRDVDARGAALANVTKAHKHLQQIDLAGTDPNHFHSVIQQLRTIEQLVQKLIADMEKPLKFTNPSRKKSH